MDEKESLDVIKGIKMKTKKRSRTAQDLVYYMLLIIGVGWLVYTYQVLIGPLIISCVMAYLLFPVVTWLSNWIGIDRRKIIPIFYLLLLITLVLVIVYISPVIANQVSLLTSQMVTLPDQADQVLSKLERSLGLSIPLDSYIEQIEADSVQLLKPERLFKIIQGATTNIIWVVLIFITSFHLLRDWEKLREWFFRQVPDSIEGDLRQLHQEIKVIWQAYLRGQLVIMLILGTLSGIGAAVMGVPGAMILGFLAGTLALIPNLGPAIATGTAALVAWTQGSTYLDLPDLAITLIVVAIFMAIQVVETFWLTPRIMSRHLNLHPGLILITVVGTLFTLGALMALISVPLLGSLDLIIHYTQLKRAGLDPYALSKVSQAVNEEADQNKDGDRYESPP
jgi:predicted PurR-regulated permease PerM